MKELILCRGLTECAVTGCSTDGGADRLLGSLASSVYSQWEATNKPWDVRLGRRRYITPWLRKPRLSQRHAAVKKKKTTTM